MATNPQHREDSTQCQRQRERERERERKRERKREKRLGERNSPKVMQ